jgi:hypothetical protein
MLLEPPPLARKLLTLAPTPKLRSLKLASSNARQLTVTSLTEKLRRQLPRRTAG